MANVTKFEFDFAVAAVKTLVDHGIRVYIDLHEDAIETAAILMACKSTPVALHATVTELDKKEAVQNDKPATRKRGYNKD
jgi:hypothetical protein